MREIITNRDIGTTIDFRTVGPYEARNPWPAETVVSAGRGVVLRRKPREGQDPSYTTLFMEFYPPGASFIRGEGTTPVECEDNAWAKYNRALGCSDATGEHQWESRGYRNGAGFCAKCNTFAAHVFTGEQLGQFCRDCGVGTTWDYKDDPVTKKNTFLCERCCPPWPEIDDPEIL